MKIQKRGREYLQTQWVALKKKETCLHFDLKEDTISVLQLCSIYKHPSTDRLEQIIRAETQEMDRKLSPQNIRRDSPFGTEFENTAGCHMDKIR